MLRVKTLKRLLAMLDDNVKIMVYEGEGAGLRLFTEGKIGWIEVGFSEEIEPNEKKHDLSGK